MKSKISVLALSAMLFALCSSAGAQQTGKVPRIGFLDNSTASGMAILIDAFRQELSKLGWVEGKNFAMEYRFAGQKLERVRELAEDLVRQKVDLIVVSGTPSGLAAKKETLIIPIVMATSGDPVGAGLVVSLAQPRGNVTGLSALAVELNTKRLEILTNAVPKLARVGLLHPPGSSVGRELQLKELRDAAVVLNVKLEQIETQLDGKGFERAFQTAKEKRVGGIMTTNATSFFTERKRIVELAGKCRLPAIYFQKEFVDEAASCLMG